MSNESHHQVPHVSLPTELLEAILGFTLSAYLHDLLLVDSPSQLQWNAVSTLLATSYIFRIITLQTLRDTLGIIKAGDENELISSIKQKMGMLMSREIDFSFDPPRISYGFFWAEPRSPYMRSYYSYHLGIVVGRGSFNNFNPIEASLRSWAVEPRQLSMGVHYLSDALKSCRAIIPQIMSEQIETAVLKELMHQLVVRQFQVWGWCFQRAFHLLPLSTAENREFVGSAIQRLLKRISTCEDLSPSDMGYSSPSLALVPFEKVAHLPKATRQNLEESKLLSCLEQLSNWEDDPNEIAPWRADMDRLIRQWREATS